MSLPAHRAEAEFDDLLGQLTNELAMTTPSQSAVALAPEPEPTAWVESTTQMASDAAVAAGVVTPAAVQPDMTMVKVVGIFAAALTVVGVAGIVVFGGREPAPVAEAPAAVIQDEDASARAELLLAQRQAAEQAAMQARVKARADMRAAYVRHEAAQLQSELKAQAEAKSKKKKRRRRSKKKKHKSVGLDFDSL